MAGKRTGDECDASISWLVEQEAEAEIGSLICQVRQHDETDEKDQLVIAVISDQLESFKINHRNFQ